MPLVRGAPHASAVLERLHLWLSPEPGWRGAGDTSSDMSWYSKRAALAAVYAAAELFMITGALLRILPACYRAPYL